MRQRLVAVAIAFLAAASAAAEPIYLDELVESPLATLQGLFPGLRNEGCYVIGENLYALINIEKKQQKPWRVAITSVEPCRRPVSAPALEVRERQGVMLGQSAVDVIGHLGRPDASAAPEESLSRLGDIEYFYICRVEEGCARHKSIFMRDGIVTAISEWYSQ